MSRVLAVEDCGHSTFRWITLKKIQWEDPRGRSRVWESAERTTRRGDVDGVAIVAKILRRGAPPMLPVLKQFRPPIANYCLELPAGLVDAGETAAQAAVRELKEETGYTGRVCDVTPACSSDPGMTSANMQFAVLEVDGDTPENQNAKQQLEDGEFITVELVPWGGLLQHILAEMASTGCSVDARLLSYAWGLEHAKEVAALSVAASAAKTAAATAAAAAAATASAAAAADGAAEAQTAGQVGGVTLSTATQQPQLQQGVHASVGLELPVGASSPFGSPIVSAVAPALAATLSSSNGETANRHPPAMSLDAQSAAAAPVAAAPAAPAGSNSLLGQEEKGSCAGGKSSSSNTSSHWRRSLALFGCSRQTWLPFAAGVAAGAVLGCSALLLANGNASTQTAAAT